MKGSAARAAASLLGLWVALLGGPGSWFAGGAPEAAVAPVRADSALASPVGLPIARLELETRGLFDPVPPGRLAPLYRLADRLHVRTRGSTIRHQLLVAPGERWSEASARESERALRALDIFTLARVEGRRAGDSAVVLVATRDAWTTTPEISLERGGGRSFGSVQFSEHNLLGRAQTIAVGYQEEPAGISRSIEVADPGVAGTRVRVSALASGGSSGTLDAAAVELPFSAEDTPLSFGVRAERAATDARLYDSGVEAASFPRTIERVEAFCGRGRRRDGTIARVVGSLLIMDRRFGPIVPTPGAPTAFAGGEERLRVRRLSLEARLWRPRFVERTGVERLDGIEDFDLGHSLSITGGFSPRALGGSDDQGFAALRLGTGLDARGAGFGWLRIGASTRMRAGPREASARLEARWVNQALPRHTMVVAALGAAGWRTARDFQLVVGGLNGLRAHEVHALSGDRLWQLNAESRWRLAGDVLHLVSLGAAGFWDAARTRGPGSGGAPWQHDVGMGLRLSPARSSRNRVARFDVAWRIAPLGPGPREAVFSFGSSQAF